MKIEQFSSASSGVFAVAGSWLVANGSSPAIAIIALIGAVIAVLDLEVWNWRRVASLLAFNTIVGAFGAPVLLLSVGMPVVGGVALIVPFLLGWAGHSVITELRGRILSHVATRITGGGLK